MRAFVLILLACTGKPEPTDSAATDDSGGDSSAHTGETAAPDTAPDTSDPCYDAPTVTYANFGRGFMTVACQGCHASTAADRYDAPEGVSFDDVDQCWEWSDRILVRATGDDPGMPPQGGVTEDERQLLYWWLTCAEPGT